MLREYFLGRKPSHFHTNAIVKSFIISETFIWSAWNFVTPIFAIFAATKIPGGNVQVAASAFSTYLAVRVVFELISGSTLSKSGDIKKLKITILGMTLMSIAYIGFALTKSVPPLFLFYALMGMGLGVSTPAKVSLFSTHLDKDKESKEWAMHDAAAFMGMALSAALGGFIANSYGFQLLFLLASVVNLLGIIPYLLYINQDARNLLG